MTECPGEGPDTTGQGRWRGPEPQQPVAIRGCVLGPSRPSAIKSTVENATRLVSTVSGSESRVSSVWECSVSLQSLHVSLHGSLHSVFQPSAKARERSEQERGGGQRATGGSEGSGGRELGATTGSDRRVKAGHRTGGRNSSSGSGVEASPSSGWREVAATMHAEEGCNHE